MSGVDLVIERQQKLKDLDYAMHEVRTRGRALAEAEKDYRIALRLEILSLRMDGYPVTIIPDMARGNNKVATLRCQRDCADADYRSVLEAINSLKLSIKILDADIERGYRQ